MPYIFVAYNCNDDDIVYDRVKHAFVVSVNPSCIPGTEKHDCLTNLAHFANDVRVKKVKLWFCELPCVEGSDWGTGHIHVHFDVDRSTDENPRNVLHRFMPNMDFEPVRKPSRFKVWAQQLKPII